MPCNFTGCLGLVGVLLEAIAVGMDDEASPLCIFFTKLHGIIPFRPSNLLALYQFGSLELLMIVRESPRLNGRSYGFYVDNNTYYDDDRSHLTTCLCSKCERVLCAFCLCVYMQM